MKNIGSTIKNFLGFSEPKEGPLSNFHTYAPDMMKLFAQGIEDNADIVRKQFDKSLDFGTASMSVSRAKKSYLLHFFFYFWLYPLFFFPHPMKRMRKEE